MTPSATRGSAGEATARAIRTLSSRVLCFPRHKRRGIYEFPAALGRPIHPRGTSSKDEEREARDQGTRHRPTQLSAQGVNDLTLNSSLEFVLWSVDNAGLMRSLRSHRRNLGYI